MQTLCNAFEYLTDRITVPSGSIFVNCKWLPFILVAGVTRLSFIMKVSGIHILLASSQSSYYTMYACTNVELKKCILKESYTVSHITFKLVTPIGAVYSRRTSFHVCLKYMLTWKA